MEADLFNEKTVKRLCSNIKVSPKQKKNADEWIKLLESGSLVKERTNYFKFALYVLRDILGYSIREDLGYEKSNIEFTFKDSLGKTILCIEVKGESKDLFGRQTGYGTGQETPFKQTWDNMGRIDSIKYGICTNYRDFILIDKSKGYSKIHFFNFLTIKNNPDKLKEFIAIFSKESIIDKGFIETLYEKSVIEEREFTKQFYKLFHETRLMLIKEFQDNGATRDEAIHFAQIYLNRLMFMFFAEDTGKLKPRLFEDTVLNLLKVESVFSENSHLVCNLIKSMFESLNKGSKRHDIFGFNGGLFQEDIPGKIFYKDFQKKTYFNEIYQYSTLKKEIELDEHAKAIIDIHDENVNPITINLLYMASFDFNTEVSVNILGHIFEQSISDLEELKEEKVLRRKKEGVYYTPNFITDYICRNTIIPYLSRTGANSVEKLIDEYANDIDELENRFKKLKILDPACGSGSFLLKAVDVLLEIYKQIQIGKEIEGQYTAKKTVGLTRKQKKALRDNLQLSFQKWHEEDEAREIIENNIFGVDINEESVEVTKLSLFLKIARKNRKLIDLSNNIKCGNSLIDDFKVAGANAFKWDQEFKEIFDTGGFDIIIGNPPYVRQELFTHLKPYFEKHYSVYHGMADLYAYFIEKSISLTKENGYFSMIFPNKFLRASYGKALRQYLLNSGVIEMFIDFGDLPVFEDATTYPAIIAYKKGKNGNGTFDACKVEELDFTDLRNYIEENKFKVDISMLGTERWNLTEKKNLEILEKIKQNSISLKKYVGGEIYRGILTGLNKVFIIDEDRKKQLIAADSKSEEIIKSFLTGKGLKRYQLSWENSFLIFTRRRIDIERYPAIKNYLLKYKADLEPKKDRNQKRGRKPGNYKWFEIQDTISYYKIFEKPKIVYPRINKSCNFYLDETDNIYVSDNNFVISTNSKSLLALLNSKLIFFYLKNICSTLRGNYYDFRRDKVATIPISENISGNENDLAKKADLMQKIYKDLDDTKNRFIRRLKHNLQIKNITKKLTDIQNHTFNEFLKELKKQNIVLTLTEQDEWEDYFNKYKKELINLKNLIDETDNEIDEIVYKLYGITEEEKKIIEASL